MALIALFAHLLQSLISFLVAPGIGLETQNANETTEQALVEALRSEGVDLSGWSWLGRMPSVGNGTRDTLVYVPRNLDPRRPVELVVFMDGYYSFAPPTMKKRHVPGIRELLESRRNFVYASPDVPPTAHGDNPSSNAPYWARRCRSDCTRASKAPGDFVAFHRDLTRMVRRQLRARGHDTRRLRFELTLIGYSRGGDGVYTAIRQLARSRGAVRLRTVNLRRVVFADAVYAYHWVTSTWKRIRRLPSLVEMSLLLQSGHGDSPGAHNRRIATHFLRRYIRRDVRERLRHTDELCLGRVHALFLQEGHTAIGNRAVHMGARCRGIPRVQRGGQHLHARK